MAGRSVLIEYLKYTTPSFVFSTATPPASAAAALTAIQLLREEPERVACLRDRVAVVFEVGTGLRAEYGKQR